VGRLTLADERPPWIGPDGRVMERLELHLAYTCPEDCVFCSESHRMQRFARFPVTFGRVARVLRSHAQRGIRSVHLTGGEPTTHPRFVDVLELAGKLGLRRSVGTIGTMLCRPAFAREAAPLMEEVLFSVHGPDAATHDALVGRSGSFDQIHRAITLCREQNPALDLFVNTVVVRANLPLLQQTLDLADSLGAGLVVVSNLSPEGAGYDRFEELAPRIDELTATIDALSLEHVRAVVRFFGIPMCLLGDKAAMSNDLHWDPRVTVEWTARPDSVVLDDAWSWKPTRGRRLMPVCSDCSRSGLCAGVWRRYAELWPVDGLEPIP
jgi:MoaA/NifB/PqqE/SkfB family radical SAM enzyme